MEKQTEEKSPKNALVGPSGLESRISERLELELLECGIVQKPKSVREYFELLFSGVGA